MRTSLQKRPAGIGILITYAVFVSLLLIFLDIYSILTGSVRILSLLTLNIFVSITIIVFAFQTNQGKNKARKIFLTLVVFQSIAGNHFHSLRNFLNHVFAGTTRDCLLAFIHLCAFSGQLLMVFQPASCHELLSGQPLQICAYGWPYGKRPGIFRRGQHNP